MSNLPAIETSGLTKHYGEVIGVESLDLRIEPGEVFGFLGPNGAGKTTTIRMLVDLIRPTRGSARVCGCDTRADSLAVRRRTGYLPGELKLPAKGTARHLLEHVSRLRGGAGSGAIGALSERLGLQLDRTVEDLSKGNRQKIGVVAALMHDPEVLILDEPTAGLDPLRQHDVGRLVRERAEAGRTVFLSSHALDQVEHVADRVGIVRDGRLVAVETVAGLKSRAPRRVRVRLSGPAATDGLAAVPGVGDLVVHDGLVQMTVKGSMAPLIAALARLPVETLTSEEPELDEIFLTYYGGGDAS